MKQVLYRQGHALVEQVPVPQTAQGTILVRVDHSAISIGTELTAMRSSALPVWKRAIKKPYLVKRAFQFAANNGVRQTRRLIRDKANARLPIGYSAAGVVEESGDEGFQPGDRVACAGAQCAYHAEYIRVPINLAAHVPDNVALSHAGTVALGAIALQGVRRAEPTLGETFIVIGLGVIGQLTSQILRANGCRVIGIDPDQSRVDLALLHGVHAGIDLENGIEVEQVIRLSDGCGADGVIITASTSSDAVVSSAFNMCRPKGRVVLVGDVGLNLNRSDMYEKELDFRISTSYGPGRYDDHYEEHGLDYPIGYVRWTENRNMQAYLQMLSEQRINIENLISAVFPVDQATEAYEQINSGQSRPLMVLLNYPHSASASLDSRNTEPASRSSSLELSRKIINPTAQAAGTGQIRLAVVGPGAFAKGTHLPNLQSLRDRYHIQAVVSSQGHNAVAVAQQYGADYATTDYDEILNDDQVDAVLICTRHNRHADMALQALRSGKHVLLEKPLALSAVELKEIEAFFTSNRSSETPVLLTGFNRRFSPSVQRILELTRKRSNPMIINYVMNAGYIPLNHWTHTEEGGGRNRGEACHIYDLFTCLTDSHSARITSHPINPTTQHYSFRDNFVSALSFEDGSVATLTYTALGSEKHSKEQMQIYVDGQVIALDDYRQVQVAGSRSRGISSRIAEKGHKQELIAFADAIQHGGAWPIPLWQQVQATEIALTVEHELTKPQ